MKHLFFPPHRALQQFIKGYNFLYSDNVLNMKAIPVSDGISAEIGILPPTGNSGLKVKYYHENKEIDFKSYVGHVINKVEYIRSDGHQLRYIGIITYPYINRFLFQQDPLVLVTGSDIGLFLKTDFDEISEKLEYAPTPAHCCTVLDKFFLQFLSKAKKIDDRLNVMFNDPYFFKKNNDTGQMAKSLYTTSRSLQRLFKETVGVSPKKLLNIIRANDLVTDIKLGRFSNSTDIASTYRFCDQSHFHNEFKAVTNLTPGFFIKNRDRLFLNYARHLIMLDKDTRCSE